MSFGGGCYGYTSNFWVGEDMVYCVSEPCCRIRRGKLGSPEWIRFTDPREGIKISKVANQVLSPIAGTNTGNFVSDHYCHGLLLVGKRLNYWPGRGGNAVAMMSPFMLLIS